MKPSVFPIRIPRRNSSRIPLLSAKVQLEKQEIEGNDRAANDSSSIGDFQLFRSEFQIEKHMASDLFNVYIVCGSFRKSLILFIFSWNYILISRWNCNPIWCNGFKWPRRWRFCWSYCRTYERNWIENILSSNRPYSRLDLNFRMGVQIPNLKVKHSPLIKIVHLFPYLIPKLSAEPTKIGHKFRK